MLFNAILILMDKTNNRLREIFNLYANKMASEDEKNELWDYINDPIFANEIDELIGGDYERPHQEDGLSDHQKSIVLQNVLSHKVNTIPKSKHLWSRMVAAASVIVVVGLGLYFYRSHSGNEQQTSYAHDIAPGKNKATLTLANGQKILIDEARAGNIASQSGVRISKTADGQIIYEITASKSGKLEYNTLTTTRGEQTQVRLPDGSIVFLNAASSLKYPTSFIHLKERRVDLSGEGYFEISKDKAHPFIVKTAKQEVEVLGTHFNINAYEDEPAVKTTLLEGSIKLSTKGHWKVLKPNEQATLSNNGIDVQQADTEETVAWKNNEFLFKNDDFRTNMRKIARWYNVEVVYASNVPENFRFGGFLSRSRNLSEVLRLMEKTGTVHFQIEGRKVHVSK